MIRQAQEAVELSLKAALRFVGIEPPKWHDVGPVIMENLDRFPKWFTERAEWLATISRRLRREREPSMYGDEETGLPPDRIYTKFDAKEALGWAEEVFRLCSNLI